jgi:hypothetical protein
LVLRLVVATGLFQSFASAATSTVDLVFLGFGLDGDEAELFASSSSSSSSSPWFLPGI